jgi:ankyrin repeat protein
MPGHSTPEETLERLRKEAKRRLKAFQSGKDEAIRWFRRTLPNGPASPTLRDMQLAVARSLDFPGWAALKQALDTPLPPPASKEAIVNRFLDNACPDHHVRGRQDHRRAEATAMRLLAQHPWLSRHDFNTAVVCGVIEYVRDAVARNPHVAVDASSSPSALRAVAGGANDLYGDLGPKGWTPLLYLSFTRLPLRSTNDNAVEIGRTLLAAGADPNAFFHAGGSHYTPMTGVAGEGEEDRPGHPRKIELTQLLLDAGANPYDIQVVYDLGFHSDYLWWLPMIYESSVARGRRSDWKDPEWHMLDMGGYGCGARWLLEHAIIHNQIELAKWCLEHGAGPNVPPGRSDHFSQRTLYEEAVIRGRREIADLLLRRGAVGGEVLRPPQKPYEALHGAAHENRPDEIHRLIDAGVSPDVADDKNMRALHAAAYANALDAAQALVARGAEVDAVEARYGGTPFGGASHFLNREVMDYLATLTRDVWNLTYNGYVDRLRVVLDENPERARVDWDDWSPLLWLPPHDEDVALDAAKLLVKHGADPRRRASNGATPLTRAEALGMTRVAEFFRSFD